MAELTQEELEKSVNAFIEALGQRLKEAGQPPESIDSLRMLNGLDGLEPQMWVVAYSNNEGGVNYPIVKAISDAYGAFAVEAIMGGRPVFDMAVVPKGSQLPVDRIPEEAAYFSLRQ
ncbi:hypothetical protein J4470_03235 [Candidatus Woesearchaeota archaeon]|nr:hypothetical protein [Candidatus Woesearchaeota archaeon]